MRRLIGVLVLAVGSWLAGASVARGAGRTTCYGCRLPDGAPTGATGGWRPFVTSFLGTEASGTSARPADRCSDPFDESSPGE